jgi:hypothetical protein
LQTPPKQRWHVAHSRSLASPALAADATATWCQQRQKGKKQAGISHTVPRRPPRCPTHEGAV